MDTQTEPAPAVAGDEHANDEYTVTGAGHAVPPPPAIFSQSAVEREVDTDEEQDGGEDGGSPAPNDGPDPEGDPEGETVAVEDAHRDQLQAEVDRRELEVKGTGANGRATVDDMKSALTKAGVSSIPSE